MTFNPTGRWKAAISLKHLLTDQTTPEAIKALAEGALQALKNYPDAPTDQFTEALALADSDSETALLVVNDAMDLLYDWADIHRIWIG